MGSDDDLDDVDRELQFHIDQRVDDLVARGVTIDEARRQAHLEFGGVMQVKEACRDQRAWPLVAGLWQDVRLAFRTLRATPIVTAVAILSLALGIGANTATFSIVNSLLLRTLPVKDPARLVLITDGAPTRVRAWTYPVWDQIRQRPQLFDAVAAWSVTRFNLASGGETQFVDGLWASGSFFETLGVPALFGRTFSDVDDRRTGGTDGPVAVISYSFWQRQFGSAADAIGRTLRLDGVRFTIVGVTPPDFFGADVGRTFDVIVPVGNEPLTRGRDTFLDTGVNFLTVIARLRTGQSLDAAAAGLRHVQTEIRDATIGDLDRFGKQAVDRYLKEITIGVTALTTFLFGTAPAAQASGVAPMEALKEHGRSITGHGRGELASWLVLVQVALSVVLVVAAGLFVRSFVSLAGRPLGFQPSQVLVITVDTQRAMVDPSERIALYERIREAVRELPNVAAAAVSITTPVGSGQFTPPMETSGLPFSETQGRAFGNLISPGWFSTFGTRVLAGRDFNDRDRQGRARVAVVNEAFGRTFLNGGSPLGRSITLYPHSAMALPPMEIVGVAADAVYASLRDPVPPTWYVPLSQFDQPGFPIVSAVLSVRSKTGSPMTLTKMIGAAITGVNPQLALTYRPLTDQVKASLTQERVIATLSGFFGGLALLLAGLGLYGVTSCAVAGRRTEIGIRMALGAAPGSLIRLVLARVTLLVGVGVVIGAGVSAWASKFVASLLYGLEPRDPSTVAVAALVLASVGMIAGWIPASRASRIDPAEVLRES